MSGLNSYWGYFELSSLSRVTSAVQREVVAWLQLLVLHRVDTLLLAGKLVGLGQVIVISAHRRGQSSWLYSWVFSSSSYLEGSLKSVGGKEGPVAVIFDYTYSSVKSSLVACCCSCVEPVVCFCSDWGDNFGRPGGLGHVAATVLKNHF